MESAFSSPPEPPYTDVEQGMWSTLMSGYRQRIHQHGCKEFIEGFDALGFTARIEHIPSLSERVRAACGWHLQPVDALLPNPEFFTLLSRKIFPVAAQLRDPREMHFSEQPDLFHDSLGHLPLLLHPSYSGFLEKYASVATRHLDNEASLKRLTSFYWYIIETGLVRQQGQTKLLGAAIVTSESECANVYHPATQVDPFSFDAVFSSCYDSFKLQRNYFVIESFQSLVDLSDRLESSLHRFEDSMSALVPT